MSSVAERRTLLGCAIDPVTMDEAVDRVDAWVAEGRPSQHAALNAAKLVRLQRDGALRDAVSGCDLVTADGQAVVWAARLLGVPVPTRVAGIDLMDALLERAAERGYGVYLLGAREEVLMAAVRKLHERFPRLRIVGHHHGYYGADGEDAVVELIRAAQPQLLFVALETPQKELFVARHASRIGPVFAMGVGGAIDIAGGLRKRAPRAFRRLGLEWLYRLMQDPRRLARRYLVGNIEFTLLVLRAALRKAAT